MGLLSCFRGTLLADGTMALADGTMADDVAPVTVFAALEPEAALASLIQGYKEQTRALVGQQLYLSDPPHLTIYLAAFPVVDAALAPWRHFAGRNDPVPIELVGWHVFEADALTGNHTLACDIAARDKARLRLLQRDLVDRLAPARDPVATRERFAPRIGFLTDHERACVERHGFPYVGEGWEPHFTIASVRPADWPKLWSALEPQAPRGPYRCARLRLYRLVDGKFHAIDGLNERD